MGIASWRSDDPAPVFFAGAGLDLALFPSVDYLELFVLRLEALRTPTQG
jgi:hypothetical protein